VEISLGALPIDPPALILRVTLGEVASPARERGCCVDRELVERAQRGDEVAFATLVERSGDRLHAVAHHILRDPDSAADATQRAFIDIWCRLRQLRDPDHFDAWAYRIVVRAAYAESRSRSAWAIRPREGPTDRRSPDHGQIEDRDQLDRGFARLSVDHRAVVVLKHYNGLSNGEIARILEISEGTVRSRLYYAMQTLRAALEADRRTPEAVAR
jgi:RNA polymerase sigma-70 factor (ECF subfamily)